MMNTFGTPKMVVWLYLTKLLPEEVSGSNKSRVRGEPS